jgi:hypothetical protein
MSLSTVALELAAVRAQGILVHRQHHRRLAGAGVGDHVARSHPDGLGVNGARRRTGGSIRPAVTAIINTVAVTATRSVGALV